MPGTVPEWWAVIKSQASWAVAQSQAGAAPDWALVRWRGLKVLSVVKGTWAKPSALRAWGGDLYLPSLSSKGSWTKGLLTCPRKLWLYRSVCGLERLESHSLTSGKWIKFLLLGNQICNSPIVPIGWELPIRPGSGLSARSPDGSNHKTTQGRTEGGREEEREGEGEGRGKK